MRSLYEIYVVGRDPAEASKIDTNQNIVWRANPMSVNETVQIPNCSALTTESDAQKKINKLATAKKTRDFWKPLIYEELWIHSLGNIISERFGNLECFSHSFDIVQMKMGMELSARMKSYSRTLVTWRWLRSPEALLQSSLARSWDDRGTSLSGTLRRVQQGNREDFMHEAMMNITKLIKCRVEYLYRSRSVPAKLYTWLKDAEALLQISEIWPFAYVCWEYVISKIDALSPS